MKKHLFIWIFGILALPALWIAEGLSAEIKAGAEHDYYNIWYAIWIIFQLLMTYGAWLLLKEKNRPKVLIIFPLFMGLLGAIIIYLIPKKKTIAESNIEK